MVVELHKEKYFAERKAYWNGMASRLTGGSRLGKAYHARLAEVYGFLIPPGSRVLEIGCGHGDLLAALKPSRGVGVDLSDDMVRLAAANHPECTFLSGQAEDAPKGETFDAVILSDLLNDVWDVQDLLEMVARVSTSDTRVIINIHSRPWELPITAAQKLGLATATLQQNWLTPDDLKGLLNLADFEVIRTWHEFLWPFRTPVISAFFNKFLVRLWPWRIFALTNFVLARPRAHLTDRSAGRSVSVVIPARNESGNVPAIFSRMPRLGSATELIFVEGHSTDDTYSVIKQAIAANPDWSCKLLKQTGKGKADAVRLGFAQATNDILMILDADLTVPPEGLPRFYEAIASGKGEMINGVRLVYPMEKQAMQFINMVGNKFFSLAFTWLIGQPIKDTLCGTKVLSKRHYDVISQNRSYFGDFDPFGDYDLLFGAAKLGLKIVDVPIRYRQRTYGETNISRWRHGALLIRMICFAARRIKFV